MCFMIVVGNEHSCPLAGQVTAREMQFGRCCYRDLSQTFGQLNIFEVLFIIQLHSVEQETTYKIIWISGQVLGM